MNRNALKRIIRESINQLFRESYGVDVDDELERYIIDAIDLSGHDLDNVSDYEKINEFYNIFLSEKDWHIEQVGVKKALEDYLRGLPSSIDLPTYYNDIRNFMYAIGFNEVKDMEDEELDRFYYNKLVETILNAYSNN
jgi:hypothetical protein